MRILQFAFGSGPGNPFLPHHYDPGTVVYTGTHDNDTLRGWWQAAPERERRFAGTYLACGAHDVHWAMIRAAFNSVAHLAVVPLLLPVGLLLLWSQLVRAHLPFDEAVRRTIIGVVTMIPEGLVLLTSIAMAVSVVRLAQRGDLRYSVERLPLEGAAEAHRRIRTGDVDGRLVLIP